MQRLSLLALTCASLLVSPVALDDDPPAPPKTPAPAPKATSAPSKAPAKPRKARKGRHKKNEQEAGPASGPVASFPGFRMLPDGGSRIFVEVSEKVKVTEQNAQGRVVYRLEGARVPVSTNRLPLLTGYFATPVSRVQLVPNKEGTDLVLELRIPSQPTYRVVDSPRGIVLQVDFPQVPAGPLPNPSEPPPPRAKRSTTTHRIKASGEPQE